MPRPLAWVFSIALVLLSVAIPAAARRHRLRQGRGWSTPLRRQPPREHDEDRVVRGGRRGRLGIALHLRPEPARRQPRQLHHNVVTGQPTDPGANYRVATNDFAINGGDSYATFR